MLRVNVNLSTLLGARRLKISKVSRDTGISRTTLTSLYYSGAKGITFPVLAKLCDYLDCSLDDLIKIGEDAVS